jgi:hypothetical protein
MGFSSPSNRQNLRFGRDAHQTERATLASDVQGHRRTMTAVVPVNRLAFIRPAITTTEVGSRQHRPIVGLTPGGRELVDAALADLLDVEHAMLAGLDSGARERLSALLRDLLGQFNA